MEAHANYRRINSYEKMFRWQNESEVGADDAGWVFDRWDHSYTSLISGGVGVSKTIDDFYINSKVDAYTMKSKLYFNLSAQAKYYPLNDGKTNIQVVGSIGSAPEETMIDFAMPGTFNHLNTMVGLGGQYRLMKNVTCGVLGSWYTYYTQNKQCMGEQNKKTEYSTIKYKNLFNIDAQLSITF